MKNLIQVTYEEESRPSYFDDKGWARVDGRLAPNNFCGRLGSTVYQNTDNGFGAIMSGMFVFGIGIPVAVGASASSFLPGLILALAIISSYVFVMSSMTYARITAKPFSSAVAIAEVLEDYRQMSRGDREVVKSLVHNIENNVKHGNAKSAYERVQKFNEVKEHLAHTYEITEDRSDIHAADAFVKGLKELESSHKKALARP